VCALVALGSGPRGSITSRFNAFRDEIPPHERRHSRDADAEIGRAVAVHVSETVTPEAATA